MTSSTTGLVLLYALACAQARAAGDTPGSGPGPQESVATLQLVGGATVTGALLSSDDPARIRWQAPAFTVPFDFPLDALEGVQFPSRPDPAKPTGEYAIELAGGDRLFGSLESLTADEAEVDVVGLGPLHLRRGSILGLYRQDGADVLYRGPNGLSGWNEPGGEKLWREEIGRPVTDHAGAVLIGDVGLPTRASVELEVSWNARPDFVVELGASKEAGATRGRFRLEVWKGELVALVEAGQEADLAPIQRLEEGAGSVRLVAYLDQEIGRLLVYTPAGAALADLTVAPGRAQPQSGLRISSNGGSLRLERLRIHRWDGAPPREVDVGKPRLERRDGSVVYGDVAAMDPATREFLVSGDGREPARIPGDEVTNVVLVSPRSVRPTGAVQVVCLDGTRLSGAMAGVREDRLELSSPAVREALRVPLARLRSLMVAPAAPPTETVGSEGPARPPESPRGRLEADGVSLPGWLVDGRQEPGSVCLRWQPEHSATASPLREGLEGSITYREPPPPPPPAPPPTRLLLAVRSFFEILTNTPFASGGPGHRALYLRNGDAVPCEVSRVDEDGVAFRSPLCDAKYVANEKVKAVELVYTDGPPHLEREKRERLLMLPRVQQPSPPTHLICSKAGDFLRGRLVGLDEKEARVEVRADVRRIDRSLISQIIWLHRDELPKPPPEPEPGAVQAPSSAPSQATDSSSSPAAGAVAPSAPGEATPAPKPAPASAGAPAPEAPTSAPLPGPPPGPPLTLVKSRLGDGTRLTFRPSSVSGGILSGTSEALGTCHVSLAEVDQLLFGPSVEQNLPRQDLAYLRWKLHRAIQPIYIQVLDGPIPQGATPGTDSPLVGKPAPDFELELLDGKKYRLSSRKGHVVVLDFWATWCGPCLQSMPRVEKTLRELEDDRVELVAVNLEEPADQVASTLERHKLQLAVALDRDGVVAAKYEATAIPQTVVIDLEGKVSRLFVGGGSQLPDHLRNAVRELLPAKE